MPGNRSPATERRGSFSKALGDGNGDKPTGKKEPKGADEIIGVGARVTTVLSKRSDSDKFTVDGKNNADGVSAASIDVVRSPLAMEATKVKLSSFALAASQKAVADARAAGIRQQAGDGVGARGLAGAVKAPMAPLGQSAAAVPVVKAKLTSPAAGTAGAVLEFGDSLASSGHSRMAPHRPPHLQSPIQSPGALRRGSVGKSTVARPQTPTTGRVLNFSNVPQFVTQPVPPTAGMLECRVVRFRSGSSKLYPTYQMIHDISDKVLLAARKRKKSIGVNYLMSTSAESLERGSEHYVGKLRTGVQGSTYRVWDEGVNPAHKKKAQEEGAQLRCQLAAICNERHVLGSAAPRSFCVFIPGISGEACLKIQPTSTNEELQNLHQDGGNQVIKLVNKKPSWNESVKAHMLNFCGRVKMTSVKNFQLVAPDEPDKVLLQFGKISEDSFALDFRFPISPRQALGIVLPCFEGKVLD